MLTKKDLQEIGKIIDSKINSAYRLLQKDMIDLFTTTNERIDKTSEKLIQKSNKINIKIDKRIDVTNTKIDRLEMNLNKKLDRLDQRIGEILDHLKDHHSMAMDHNKRISKLEEKVLNTSSS